MKTIDISELYIGISRLLIVQPAHDIETLKRRRNNVILTLCAGDSLTNKIANNIISAKVLFIHKTFKCCNDKTLNRKFAGLGYSESLCYTNTLSFSQSIKFLKLLRNIIIFSGLRSFTS